MRLILLICFSLTAMADDWSAIIRRIPIATVIEVRMLTGPEQLAEVVSVGKADIVLRIKAVSATYARKEIKRIRIDTRPTRGRNTAVGAAIGITIGALLGTKAGEGGPQYLGLAGGLIGTAIGSILPTGGWKTVYTAP